MSQIRFYGRTKPDPKYWPFSNFYIAEFKDSAGTIWKTTEHYFQAMKFLPESRLNPNDQNSKSIRNYIHGLSSPAQAAEVGRRRDMPLRKDWEEEFVYKIRGNEYTWKRKDYYMFAAIYYKFSQHEDLKQLLLSTGDTEIIEDSKIDSYWGCGADGKGKNMLGKLLMKLREELKNESV